MKHLLFTTVLFFTSMAGADTSIAAEMKTLSVAANAYSGVDSGVTLGVGESVVVRASGTWSVGGLYGTYDANGTTSEMSGYPDRHTTESCSLAPSSPMGMLTGSLNGAASWFPIGSGPLTVTGPGSLMLRANDCQGPGGAFLSDNTGSVTATISPATIVAVAANAYSGIDSGVTLGVGESVVVSASGTWSVGGLYGTYDANGTTSTLSGYPDRQTTESCSLAPSSPMGMLTGSLNGGASWFPIGVGPVDVTGPGSLILRANDCQGPGGAYLSDNFGSVAVTIYR